MDVNQTEQEQARKSMGRGVARAPWRLPAGSKRMSYTTRHHARGGGRLMALRQERLVCETHGQRSRVRQRVRQQVPDDAIGLCRPKPRSLFATRAGVAVLRVVRIASGAVDVDSEKVRFEKSST
jgi:hypothetical protein